MLPSELLGAIRSLAGELILLDAASPAKDWFALREHALAITQGLADAGAHMASDCAERMAALAGLVENGILADPAFCIRLLGDAASALQFLDTPRSVDPNHFRQIVAEMDSVLRDYSNAPQDTDTHDSPPEIEEEFVQEIRKRIDGLEQLLFEVRPPLSDPETVRTLFREIHTLKGEAGIVGHKRLSEFWHRIESAIEDARHGRFTFTRPMIDQLLVLLQFGNQILHGLPLPPDSKTRIETCIRILDTEARGASPRPDAGSSPEAVSSPPEETGSPQPAPPPAPDEDEADDFFSPAPPPSEPEGMEEDFFAEAVRRHGQESPATEAAASPSMPTPPEDSTETTAPIRRHLADDSGRTEKTAPESFKAPDPMFETDDLDTDMLNAADPSAVHPDGGAVMQSIAIPVSRLDALLALVGEVSMLGTQLAAHPDLVPVKSVTPLLTELGRASRGLQDFSGTLRMTSVSPLFQRTQRAALAAARQMKKRIHVHVEGRTTQVDRLVIDQLSAAFVHLVRNSMDHGIESLEDRRAAGKPPEGSITLRAYRRSGDVVLEIEDDGRGLDLESIRRKAVALGHISPDTRLRESDLAQLIFRAGLSTARAVTGLSGRGVGMSVVEESVKALRGRVDIETKPGEGTCFRIQFPAALSAVEGVFVRLGASVLVFPVLVVRETLRVTPEQVHTVEGRGIVVSIRGVVVPVISLSERLGLPMEARDVATEGVLVLVEEEDRLAALWADEVLETRQTLIRPIEGPLSRIPDIAGAVPLGDRRVAFMIDTRRLLASCNVAAGKALADAGSRQAAAGTRVETVSIGSNTVGMIDFTVCRPGADGHVQEQVFVINAFKAREFVPVSHLTPVPHAPRGFAGMLLLREETIPVVALNVLLGFLDDSERDPAWERIVVVCEFAGKTVGFLVAHVDRVSYVSWSDILPPPRSGSMIRMEHVVGTILLRHLRDPGEVRDPGDPVGGAPAASSNGNMVGAPPSVALPDGEAVAFVLDFERIVQQVFHLYDSMQEDLQGVQQRKEKNRILLVEDSPLIRRETANALRKAGIEVMEAEDGEAALHIVRALHRRAREEGVSIFTYLDLILSDIEMPKSDGYTLTLAIKNHPELRVLPVLLHSSLTNDTIITRAREVEADGFVPKCDPKTLADQLRRYL